MIKLITVKKLKQMLEGVNEDIPVVLRLEDEEAEGFLKGSEVVDESNKPYNRGDGAFDIENMDFALYLTAAL